MTSLVQKYLEISKFSNLKTDFEDLFLSHPNYPSLFALTDSLDMLSIENVAIKVPKEQLTELPDSFLTFYNEDFVLVAKSEKGIHLDTGKGQKLNVSFNEFLTDWNGVILVVEPNVTAPVKSEKNNTKGVLYSLPVIALLSLSLFYNVYTLNSVLLLLTSSVGLMVSVFIIQEKFGIKNEVVGKLCAIASNVSCDAVIKSDKTGTNKWIHFSDLPVLFFGISVLSMILQPIYTGIIVGLFSLLSIPVIVYSIWLQKFQLKKWCVLCLAVSFIMMTQCLLFVFSNPSVPEGLYLHSFGFLVSSIVLTSMWFLIKPLFEDKTKAEKEVMEIKKFKRNFDVFNFLTKTIPIIEGFDQLQGLQFGNKDAEVQLTIIISPSCGHCHKAFEDGFELVTKFPDRVFLKVLFNVNPENYDNPYQVVAENILALNNSMPEKASEAIMDWHIKKMGLEEWKEKWTMSARDMKANHQIHQQYQWCLENKFNYTPVKIINDKQFPKEYEISELKYFLNDFAEEQTIENSLLVHS